MLSVFFFGGAGGGGDFCRRVPISTWPGGNIRGKCDSKWKQPRKKIRIPSKIDLSPRMSNFIPSPNPSKSPLWNVLKVTLEPSGHLVWSWGPPGGHGLVGHLTHFQIFWAFFQSRIKKNSVHGRWVIGPLIERISPQGIRNWSQINFYFPTC